MSGFFVFVRFLDYCDNGSVKQSPDSHWDWFERISEIGAAESLTEMSGFFVFERFVDYCDNGSGKQSPDSHWDWFERILEIGEQKA